SVGRRRCPGRDVRAIRAGGRPPRGKAEGRIVWALPWPGRERDHPGYPVLGRTASVFHSLAADQIPGRAPEGPRDGALCGEAERGGHRESRALYRRPHTRAVARVGAAAVRARAWGCEAAGRPTPEARLSESAQSCPHPWTATPRPRKSRI